jgi:Domain of unknown function (DUF4184)
MPFTLAHPAAITPFKRFCPRYLSFPALIAGSVSPDLSYFSGRLDLGPFAHHPLKGFLFGVPAGLFILAVFYLFRSPALKILPARYQEIFQPLLLRPIGAPIVILASLFIGVATHIVWDSFTHNHSLLVQYVPFLRIPILAMGYTTVRLVHLLSYLCSFLGVFWLCLLYSKWRATEPPRVQWRNSLFVAALVFPISAIHHLMHSIRGLLLVGVLSLLLILLAVLRIAKPTKPPLPAPDPVQKQP